MNTPLQDLMVLANAVTKEEGGKSEASVGDVRQVLRKLAEQEAATPGSVVNVIKAAADQINSQKKST